MNVLCVHSFNDVFAQLTNQLRQNRGYSCHIHRLICFFQGKNEVILGASVPFSGAVPTLRTRCHFWWLGKCVAGSGLVYSGAT